MEKFKSFIKDTFQSLLIALIIVFFCFKFLFIPVEVIGTSMYPYLIEGQRGFSFVITKNIEIKRFDVCVIKESENNKLLVKRIIGLPNETISYIDNKLYVNGEYIAESFLNDDVYTENFEVTLNDNEYYCLGDNRSISKDSRYYGPFSKKQIVSTHIFSYLPFDRWGLY